MRRGFDPRAHCATARMLRVAAFSMLLLFCSDASAQVGGFCLPNDMAQITSPGGWILMTPDGTGTTLADAGATIEIRLTDCDSGVPIAGYPFQDIWLDDIGNGEISLCPGGSTADANTDADGRTTISGTLAGGGYSEAGLYVYLSGVAASDFLLDIRVASPDLNGDRRVDIADIGSFAIDFWSATPVFRSDFTGDGQISLPDIGVLAIHNGTACP